MLSSPNDARGIIKLDGEAIPFISCQVTNNNFYMSDTYDINLPLYGANSKPMQYWSEITLAEIEIYIGFPDDGENYSANDLELLFTGGIDNISVNATNGSVIVSGRDYSYRLIDKKLSKTYSNQTASQIAIELAEQNNLIPVVTETFTPVGVYSKGYTQIGNNVTEWDFLTYLAQEVNFNLYVENTSLYFNPRDNPDALQLDLNINTVENTNAHIEANALEIIIGRSLTLAKDVEVKIRSYSLTSGKSITATATSKKDISTSTEEKQNYVFNFPNLSPTQASLKAESLLRQITQHELTLNAKLIPDVELKKTTLIKINNTGTNFDQVFFLNNITRTLSARQGFNMEIEAKNHDTNSQVEA